ncbi:MAG: zinc-binding alcohol dehydrogenase family protein [Chitinivibrionales bacterium]|nr:zinc-binding alcohol dehydrogenase family protein [Chitinivibrionales bacterium]
MKALIFKGPGQPLKLENIDKPEPAFGQVLLFVHACAVCRTDLHIVDGELPNPIIPLIPGHEIIGTVTAVGEGVTHLSVGDRVGVPWLGWSCGKCRYCTSGRENLCPYAKFTGYTLNGGYAEYAVADERFCFPIPHSYDSLHAAPLLCAGLIGYRSLRMAGEAKRVGFFGFGAAAHILIQITRHQNREVFAFTRPGDISAQDFAKKLGAVWTGGSDELPPAELDAAIIFAPAGVLVPAALKTIAPGGTVICAGIHMSDFPSFPYRLLWEERSIKSVANLTRKDGEEFFDIAAQFPITTEITPYPLENGNDALNDLRSGKINGAGVLNINSR